MSQTQTPPSLPPELVELKTFKRRRRRSRFSRLTRRLRKRVARIRWVVIVGVFVAVITVLIVGGLVLTTDAANKVQESWESLTRTLALIQGTSGTELTLEDFERLQLRVDDFTNSLAGAQRQTGFLRPFVFLNADLDVTLQALDAARDIALAASDMLTGMEPTLFFLVAGEDTGAITTQLSSGERIVELLHLGQSRFISANERLSVAQSKLDNLQLGEVSADALLTIEDMATYLDQLRQITNMLLNGPDLLTVALGLNDTQSYLALSQNSDEIFPSGGYISTYGWMVVDNARIIDYGYSPTTLTSPAPPSPQLADEITIPDWWLQFERPIYAAWDGSWYADFPSTAAMSAWFYNNGGNLYAPVDGVIAIDIVGFEYILEALESVTVLEYDEVVTPENFREVVYEIRASGEEALAHKRFVAALYNQIFADLQNVQQEHSVDLLGAFLRALQEKHIMLYFEDERLNEAVDLLGWSGRQAPGNEHDYLMVVDTNLGSKSSRSVIRQLTYDVTIQENGSLESRLTVDYDFPASLAENDPAVHPAHYGTTIDYQNLLQVIVPESSVLTGTDNLLFEPELGAIETHTIFVSLTEVAYNTSERFQFSYTTPALVETFGPYRRYRLLVQKQPGTRSELVTVQIALPSGVNLVNVSPAPVADYSLQQPILEFRLELVTDQWIEIIYAD